MKKTIMFIIMLLACVLLMPGVYAEEEHEYAKVEDITNEDTFKDGTKPVVVGSGEATTTITVDAATFQMLGTEGSNTPVGDEQRPGGYAWIGFRVTMPEEASDIKLNEESKEGTSFDKYLGFKVSSLTNAAKNKNSNVTKTYTLKWKDKDKTTEMTQTINIVIVPEKIVLYEDAHKFGENESTPVWNEEKWSEEVQKVNLTIVPVVDGKEVKLSEEIAPEVPVNYTFSSEEIKELEEMVNGDLKNTKIKFIGFYTDAKLKNKYDWTTKEEDLTIYMAFKTVKEETNPATGDNLLTYVSLSVIALTGALGTGLYLKKVNE